MRHLHSAGAFSGAGATERHTPRGVALGAGKGARRIATRGAVTGEPSRSIAELSAGGACRTRRGIRTSDNSAARISVGGSDRP